VVFYSIIISSIAITLFCIAEQLWPAQKLERVKGWWPRLLLMNGVSMSCVAAIAWGWSSLEINWSLFRLRDNGHPVLNGVFAYLLVGVINYWWHRWRHTNQALWLWFHQIHHSPSRIQALTTYYRNPIDTLMQDSLGAVFMFMVLGLGTDDLLVTATLTTVIEVYFHSNINVPLWTSYLVQSPLSHRIHHMRGRHVYNLGDIPIITDIPFGTFRNRISDDGPNDVVCGFEPHQEGRLIAMMLNEDVQCIPAPEMPRAEPHLASANPPRASGAEALGVSDE
jgi:sterol desaturase/sphingolipid hydroxylase (fatty acid hydroxylase superfamily)